MRLSTHSLLRLASLAIAAAAIGCGGEHDATEKQLAELHGEIARLRATQASLAERLDAIDIERGAFAKGTSAPPPTATAMVTPPPTVRAADRDRPELDVVHLSPSEGDGDADSQAPRPLIRASGDGGGARQTLSNKTIGSRPAPRKGVVPSAPKKAGDADASQVTKP
jgi:hypothetical protein